LNFQFGAEVNTASDAYIAVRKDTNLDETELSSKDGVKRMKPYSHFYGDDVDLEKIG